MEFVFGLILGGILTATFAPPSLVGGIQRLVRATVRRLVTSRGGGGPQ